MGILGLIVLSLAANQSIVRTDLCELAVRPDDQVGLLLDLCVLEEGGYHGAWFYDPACPSTDSIAVLGTPRDGGLGHGMCSETPSVPQRECLSTYKRLVGVLEEWAGHSFCAYGSCRFSIRPVCIEEPEQPHEPLEQDIPAGPFMSTAKAIQAAGGNLVISLAFGETDDPSSMVTHDFRYTTAAGELIGLSETFTVLAPLCPDAAEIGTTTRGFPERSGGTGVHTVECRDSSLQTARKLRCTSTIVEEEGHLRVSRLACKEQSD